MKSKEERTNYFRKVHSYSFESLDAWVCARRFVKLIYQLVKKFPSIEQFGLISQFRRAAVSIPTNLAEGSARRTHPDQANFTRISYSSLLEIVNLLFISHDLGYIDEQELLEMRLAANEVSYKINNLYKSQKAKPT